MSSRRGGHDEPEAPARSWLKNSNSVEGQVALPDCGGLSDQTSLTRTACTFREAKPVALAELSDKGESVSVGHCLAFEVRSIPQWAAT